MKSFKQFISESVNISGDFNGNLYINSQPEELVTKSGIPSKRDLGEQLQGDYPGAVVHQIYPVTEKNFNIRNAKRYHPSKLEWID